VALLANLKQYTEGPRLREALAESLLRLIRRR
jgi:hypothetical protein